ncbi:acyl-CoA thioesterase [Halocynthiibacter namhaensis]|uniref:acyl-CoA thioesterase n=1 Tax=Halocynthiibacter namhaensis TaxID=1290553 RepID=UPI000579103A|nr:thioesterase family protein [Halocynthiibacter namhaensis]
METRYHTPLSPAEMSRFGYEGDWPYGMADRVHFHELDSLNHVNNVVYFAWFENVRVAYMREWGLSTYQPGDDNPRLVVKSVSADYIREMHMGESYLVTARTKAFRNTSFTMEYALWSDGLRATGEAVVVCLEPDGQGKRPLSEDLKQRFILLDGALPAA